MAGFWFPPETESAAGAIRETRPLNFDGEKVREARENKERTTATVTVTSTRRAAEEQ